MSKTFKLLNQQQGHVPPTVSSPSESMSIDWTKCILCQETTPDALQLPAESKRTDIDIGTGYDTLAKNLERFRELGGLPKVLDQIISSLEGNAGLAATLKANEGKWHKKCRDKYNNTKLQRAEKRKKEMDIGETSSDQSKQKVTRYSSGSATSTSQETCFFCGEISGDLHRVSTFQVDRNVRQCASVLQDTILLAKLSTGDMISQDAMYHRACLTTLQRKAEQMCQSDADDATSRQLHGIALAELLTYIEESRIESEVAPVFKLADLVEMYTSRLIDLGADAETRVHSTRLKDRILAKVPDLQAHKQGRDVLLVFDRDIGLALKKSCESDFDEEGIILAKAADIVRRDMLKQKTAFSGTFSQCEQEKAVPKSLATLIGMIMSGSNIETQSSNATDVQAKLTVSQLLQYNIIVRRRQGSTSHYHTVDREPPLPIYVGLLVHATTRKRGLIDKLYDIGLSISYDRLLSISNHLGNDVCARFEAEHVVCPPKLRSGLFTTSAVDNIDHNPSSSTARGAFHGTGISLFQHPSKDSSGEDREQCGFQESENKQKTLSTLPEAYSNVLPASLRTKEPTIPEVPLNPPATGERVSAALEDDYRWLNHVKEVTPCEKVCFT